MVDKLEIETLGAIAIWVPTFGIDGPGVHLM